MRLLYRQQMQVLSCYIGQFMEIAAFFLCFSLQEELPFNGNLFP